MEGRRVGDLALPGDAVLVAIIRDGAARPPDRDSALEHSDELLFIVDPTAEVELANYLAPSSVRVAAREPDDETSL
jgi:trk system potassium uptake protein TrkA